MLSDGRLWSPGGALHGFLEAAPDAIVVVDGAGLIVAVNGLAGRMFGYGAEELVGKAVEVLVPERYRGRHVGDRDAYAADPRTRPMGEGRELAGRRRDGTEFPVEISLSPLRTDHGTVTISIARDTTERRATEARLQASVREKEVLLKEIHHRVKNNLQVTSSLLKLQSASVDDRRVRELFTDSQNRIRTMALVHEKLYQSSDLSRIDLVDYARSLAALVLRSFGGEGRRIGLRVEGAPAPVSIDSAVPCGLLLNELLSNCVKHAFPEGRGGEIDVEVAAEEERRIRLTVRDDGVGLPAGLDPLHASTLGLQLVRTLAEQLGGELSVAQGSGTAFTVRFGEAHA